MAPTLTRLTYRKNIFQSCVDYFLPHDTSALWECYLGQAVRLLQLSFHALHDITNQNLLIQQKAQPKPTAVDEIMKIRFHISVPVEVQGSGTAQFYRRYRTRSEIEEVKSNEEVLYLIELFRLYIHKLQHVVELALKAVQEDKVEKLTELKKILDEFTEVLEQITACYTMKTFFCCDGNLPNLDDLKVLKEKACSMNNNLEQDELSDLFAKYSEHFTTSYEIIWCSILGLRDQFGTFLLELEDEIKMHHSWYYFTENFIKREENVLQKNGYLKKSGLDGLIKALQKIGFTDLKAKIIAESIPIDLIDTQLPSYWAIKHLDFALMYHPLLAKAPRYPYKADVVDKWFEKKIQVSERSEPVVSSTTHKKVKMINVKATAGETKVGDFLAELKKQKKYVLLFHGTSHTNAQSILQSGVILGEGNKLQDFSHGYGFYVGEQFENAKRWTRDRRAHRAVVVFKVNKDLVDPRKEKGLDVSNDERKWKKIVLLYRNGCKNTRLEEELLDGFTFIRGHMCLNPKEAIEGRPLRGFGRHKGIQFCVRDKKYARKFGSIENIACVIFY